ncbi:hypothetical protein HDK77DRAFT_479758 [Phyllosticta capitalensis]
MFLSMLTADAAAQHGHEFSAPRANTLPSSRQSAPPRSPLNVFSSSVRPQRPQPTPLHDRKSLTSETYPPPPLRRESTLPPPKPQRSITFAMQTQDMEQSRPPSLRSNTTTSTEGRLRNGRTLRPKTTFALAHPPPRVGPFLRPRVLLQLHQSSANSRPRPAYEAIPSTKFAPKLKKKFQRLFELRNKLGPDDFVIVKAETYGADHRDGDEEKLENREVIAVVCYNAKDEKTEICMDDNTIWSTSQMPNGGYEFLSTDSHGLQTKRRWVIKPNKRVSTVSSTPQTPSSDERKFNFSTISPDTRRHPVIASMTRASIDVWDQYSMPSPTLASPARSPDASDVTEPTYPESPRPVFVTDDSLRKFILVSGVWIAFRERWSAVFKYDDPSYCRARDSVLSDPTSSPVRAGAPNRVVSMSSMTGSTSRSSSPSASEHRSNCSAHNLRTVSRLLLHRNQALAALNGDGGCSESGSNSSANAGQNRSRRANSTGASFLRRPSKRKQNRDTRASSCSREPNPYLAEDDMFADAAHAPSKRVTLTKAHVILPAIEDRKNSGEYASGDESSSSSDDDDDSGSDSESDSDDQPTPRANSQHFPALPSSTAPSKAAHQHRASLQVPRSSHQDHRASLQVTRSPHQQDLLHPHSHRSLLRSKSASPSKPDTRRSSWRPSSHRERSKPSHVGTVEEMDGGLESGESTPTQLRGEVKKGGAVEERERGRSRGKDRSGNEKEKEKRMSVRGLLRRVVGKRGN